MTTQAKNGLIFTAIALGASLLLAILFLAINIKKDDTFYHQVCSLDGRICPDGTTVSRTGPNCSFAPCPAYDSGTRKVEDEETGISYSYQTLVDNEYLSLVDQPTVTTDIAVLECGSDEETVYLDGEMYCTKSVNEGAAGSVYHTHTYKKMVNGKSTTTEFVIRMPQCANYDEEAMSECEEEQEEFSAQEYGQFVLDSVVITVTESDRITLSDLYFMMNVEDEIVAQLGQPIEGIEPIMFLAVYPGIEESDFDGVQQVGDTSDATTSADQGVTRVGMKTLLQNIARRLDVPTETQEDIDAILELID